MANKNIKNSAREARAKKMELVKEKNYQETMKKLKLKREEDAERNKANSAKLELQKKAPAAPATKKKKPVVSKTKKPEPPPAPVVKEIKKKEKKPVTKPKPKPPPPKRKARPRRQPQRGAASNSSSKSEESPEQEVNEEIEIIEKEDTPELPEEPPEEEESELVEIIEVYYDENDEEVEKEVEDEDDDSNEIIKVIEVIEDPDDYVVEEIMYMGDNQIDEKSDDDDGRTILVTIENDDSQLTSFSQDSMVTESDVEMPIEMISVSENDCQNLIDNQVKASQDVQEEEEVAMEEEVTTKEEVAMEEEVSVAEEVVTEEEVAMEVVQEEIVEESVITEKATIEEIEDKIEEISIKEKEVTNQYAAAFESLSSEAKLNIFASLINTKTPEKSNNIVVDEKLEEKQNINDGKRNSLTKLPDNLVIDSKFFESFTHKRVNGEATLSDEKIVEVTKEKVTEIPTFISNFSEMLSMKNYNSESKFIQEPTPSKDDSLQNVETFKPIEHEEELVKEIPQNVTLEENPSLISAKDVSLQKVESFKTDMPIHESSSPIIPETLSSKDKSLKKLESLTNDKPKSSTIHEVRPSVIPKTYPSKDESLQKVESLKNKSVKTSSPQKLPTDKSKSSKSSRNYSLPNVESLKITDGLAKLSSSTRKFLTENQISVDISITKHNDLDKLSTPQRSKPDKSKIVESSIRSRSHNKSDRTDREKSSKKKSSKERSKNESVETLKNHSSKERSKTESVETLKNHKYPKKLFSPQKERHSKSKNHKTLDTNDKIDTNHTKSPKNTLEKSNKDKSSKVESLQTVETFEKINKIEILKPESIEKPVETIKVEEPKIESLQSVETLEKTLKIEEIDIKNIKITPEIFDIVSECSKITLKNENCSESLQIPSSNEVITPKTELCPKTETQQDLKTIDTQTIKYESPTIPANDESIPFVESFTKKEEDEKSFNENSVKFVDDEKEGRRRSSRIKIISQSKRRSHGHGLVRDKTRFIKTFEPSTPTNVTPRTAEEQEKILAHERDMQQRLSKFLTIKENEYYCDRNISKEAKKMTCDCFLTEEEIAAGEFGCGEDCLNRLLMIECGNRCVVGDRCTNRRFQKNIYSSCDVFRTEKKGFGILASKPIRGGEFIMEYVGEVLNRDLFEKRANEYSKNQNTHFYFMSLRSEAYIDATIKGNISRFINHSCDPNAETQKWTVNGELKIGFFSRRDIAVDEEITFDYEFQNYGKEAQKCYCESANCRGWIGEEPDSDTDDSDESDEEENGEEDEEANLEEVKSFESTNSMEIENAEKSTEISVEAAPITDPTEKKVVVPIVPKVKVKKPKVKKPKKMRAEIMDDNDLDDEIMSLGRTGVKRKEHILKLSRLMVRAKNIDARCNILCLIREGELPCRRLFLDYQGLRLLYGWLSDSIVKETNANLILIIEILETLKKLPIPNKTMTKDSKVYSIVEKWANSKNTTICSPNDDSPSPETNCSPNVANTNEETPNENSSPKTDVAHVELNLLKTKVTNLSVEIYSMWENLKEIFKIPKNMKRERIEQQKEHERQADISYKSLGIVDDEIDAFKYKSRYRNQCFEGKPIETWVQPHFQARDSRRKMFEQKYIQEQHEHEERVRVHAVKCSFFGLDQSIPPHDLPFEVNCNTNEWYTADHRKLPMAPSAYSQMQLAEKKVSSNINDFILPPMNLPPDWTFAITNGLIYYYHVKIRIPQWERPIFFAPLSVDEKTVKVDKFENQDNNLETRLKLETNDVNYDENGGSDSDTDSESDGEESELLNILEQLQIEGESEGLPGLKCFSTKDTKVEDGRPIVFKAIHLDRIKIDNEEKEEKVDELLGDVILSGRQSLLAQERAISPRSAGDRKYGREQNKKYKATKERIRKDKKRKLVSDEFHPRKIRKLTEGLPFGESEHSPSSCDENLDNLSTSIELAIKAEDGETEQKEKDQEKPFKKHSAVYEEYKKKLQAKKQAKKRGGETITQPTSRRKIAEAVVPQKEERKIKDKFRTDIAGIIIQHLSFYKRESCKAGRITNDEDFKHLSKKLVHFVMLKELKHCDNAVTYLEVTESVKIKAREYIKKYMGKHGDVYVRGENEPEYKDY